MAPDIGGGPYLSNLATVLGSGHIHGSCLSNIVVDVAHSVSNSMFALSSDFYKFSQPLLGLAEILYS